MDIGTAARDHDNWRRRFPEQCEKGDEGERRTAQLLLKLPASWVVLHDVVPPGRRFNIDHLLIGPGGVIALDSKNYSGVVTVRDGTMRSGGHRRANELAAAREHAICLSDVLGVDVLPAICIHTAALPADHFNVDTIDVLAPHRLVDWLNSRPPHLLEMQISAIAAAARARLQILGPPGPPSTHQTPRPTPPSRASLPRKQSAQSKRREKLVVETLTGIVVFALAAWWIPRAALHSARSITTPTTAAAAPVTVGPPTLASGTFSCPGSGRGWTFTMPWPTRQSPTSAYEAQWSTSPEGQWSSTPTWTHGSALSVSGLRSGSNVFIRAKAAGSSADSPESMAMQKVPGGTC